MDEYVSRALTRQCSRSKSPQKITSANRIFSSIRPDDTLFDLSSVGQTVIYPAGSHLFRQNTPAESVFDIKSGLVLTYHITSSGNRRIVDFYTAGQVIGIASRGTHRIACQASTSANVAVINREAVLSTPKYNKR